MKLRSILCASAIAAAATASALTTTNTFARLPVSSPYDSTIIALPFSGCGMAEGSIYVTNLVMTTNLENGDTLMHFNGTTWDAWEISGGAWRSIATSTKSAGVTVSAPASEVAINCGEACWLNRKTRSNKFYLYGQVNAAKKPVTVAAGNGTKPTYTIVGCPYEAGSFDVKSITGAAAGDTVSLMAANDSGKKEYRYSGTAWQKSKVETVTATLPAWLSGLSGGSSVTKVSWEDVTDGDDMTVPAGCGFMYGRVADSTLTIDWN